MRMTGAGNVRIRNIKARAQKRKPRGVSVSGLFWASLGLRGVVGNNVSKKIAICRSRKNSLLRYRSKKTSIKEKAPPTPKRGRDLVSVVGTRAWLECQRYAFLTFSRVTLRPSGSLQAAWRKCKTADRRYDQRSRCRPERYHPSGCHRVRRP